MSTPRAAKRPVYGDDLERASKILGDRVRREVSLAPFTTYRVGGAASLHVHVSSMDDLYRVSEALAEIDMDVLVIGRGSNMLISDAGFTGIALTFGAFADYIDLPQKDDYPGSAPLALFGGSVTLPVAARQSVKRHRSNRSGCFICAKEGSSTLKQMILVCASGALHSLIITWC